MVGDDALVKCWDEILLIQGFVHLEGTGRDAGNRRLPYSYTRRIRKYKQFCVHIFRQPRGAGSHCRVRSKTIIGMPHVVA